MTGYKFDFEEYPQFYSEPYYLLIENYIILYSDTYLIIKLYLLFKMHAMQQ